MNEGEPHDVVAARMVEALSGHDLFASAPSWDGKWLSVLLRGAGFSRRALRLRDTDEALRETATAGKEAYPAHRALADAQGEYETWCRLLQAAHELAADSGPA